MVGIPIAQWGVIWRIIERLKNTETRGDREIAMFLKTFTKTNSAGGSLGGSERAIQRFGGFIKMQK